MALGDVTRTGVDLALKEFNRIELTNMLEKYGGGRSTKWYIQIGDRYYDQKLICRAAHEHQELGPLPSGRGTFKANEAKRLLIKLGYCVTEKSTAGP